MYKCLSLSTFKSDACTSLKELKFGSREQPTEDYYIDTITLMKDGKTTADSEGKAEINRIYL